MAVIHGIVLIYFCFQGASALLIGNFPQSRVNQTILRQETQLYLYARIFSRFDIASVPNIGNSEELKQVAEMLKEHHYEFILSEKLMKPTLPDENYAIFYRSDVFTVSDIVRDQPSGAICVKILIKSTCQEFVMVVFHLSGVNAITELEGLPSLYDRIHKSYNLENVLFVGDFNTFPWFMTEAQFNNLTVTTDPRYQWYIEWSDKTFAPAFPGIGPDTPTAAVRFLARGDIINWVVSDGTGILNTMTYYGVNASEAVGMSVFFPCYLEMVEHIETDLCCGNTSDLCI